MHVESLSGEDTLEEEMANHSSIFCLGNPIDRGVWQATVHGGHKIVRQGLASNNNNYYY